MSFAPRRLPCLLNAALLAGVMLPVTAMASPGAYLSWRSKVDQPATKAQTPPPAPVPVAPALPVVVNTAMVASGGQTYPVPPSPYGQVGDPYLRNLNWPTKPAPAKPQSEKPQAEKSAPPPLASAQPVRQPTPALITVPAAPVQVAPPAIASIAAPIPVPPPKPVSVPPAALAAAPMTTPATTGKPAAVDTGAYQVPASSKYAARIAQARSAQARSAQTTTSQATTNQTPAVVASAAPAAKGAKAEKPAKAAVATVPEPAASLASEETDHVFIPGEHYTDASQAPRYYSLHRAYGLTPDPIIVDHNATGAILDTASLNADEGDTDADNETRNDKPAASSPPPAPDSKAKLPAKPEDKPKGKS